jgi:polysaccharide biosynthesis/export protein
MEGDIMKYLAIKFIGFFIFSLCLMAEEVKEDYVIAIEDVLSISVWKEPDLSIRELVVRPDGKISMPLVNDIQASGKTPMQLQTEIVDKLKEFVATPNVTITVIRAVGHRVSIVGAVGRPGIYTLGSPTTILDLMARVGGVSEYAKAKNIKITRKENGKILQFPFNYKNAIRGIDLQKNILLKDGDIVLVP